MDPEDAADKWIEENRDKVDVWLEGNRLTRRKEQNRCATATVVAHRGHGQNRSVGQASLRRPPR